MMNALMKQAAFDQLKQEFKIVRKHRGKIEADAIKTFAMELRLQLEYSEKYKFTADEVEAIIARTLAIMEIR